MIHVGINAMQVRAAKSGVGQYIEGLLRGMAEVRPANVRITVLCTTANQANYTDFDWDQISTVVWGLDQSKRAARLAWEHLTLGRAARGMGLDLLHGASNFLPLWPQVPSVVTIHDLSYYVQPERCPPVRRAYWYALTSRTVKVADRIVTVSDNSRRDIAKYFPGAERKTTVVPEAAHARFCPRQPSTAAPSVAQRYGVPAGVPYALSVCTLEPGKNIVRIVEAFEAVAETHAALHLIIAGDKGWLYAPILERIEKSPLRSRIVVTGHVADDDVVDLMQNCRVFVYPSLYEGFGLPPLEALACGAPVVASATSSIPEVTGNAAILVDPMSVDAIAAGMQTVLRETEDEAARRRETGLRRAAEFSWRRCAEETLAVWREVISEK